MPEYKDFDMRVEEMETEQLLRRVKFHLENPEAETSRPSPVSNTPKAPDFDNLHLGNEMYFQLDYAAKIYDPRTVPQNTRFRRIKGLLMRVMRLYATRQVEFNATVVKLLNMFQDRFEETVERFNYFRQAEVRNEEALRVIDSRLEKLEEWGSKVNDIASGVAALQQRLEGLENAVRALAAAEETTAKRLTTADDSIEAISKFNENTVKRLDSADEGIKAISKFNENTVKRLDSADEGIKAISKVNENTVKRLDSADEGIKTLGRINEETAKRLTAADESIKAISKFNEETVKRLDNTDAGIKTLGRTNEETAKRLTAADESIKAIGKFNENTAKRLDAADEGIRTLGKTNEETAKRLTAADEGIKTLGKTNEEIAKRLTAADEGVKNLGDVSEKAALRISSIEQGFKELHGLVDDLQLRNAAIGGVFSELKEKLASGKFTVTKGKKTETEPSVIDDFEKAWHSADYELFEDESRGDIADIRERLEFYVPLLKKAAKGGGLIADLGCGRGELLELLKESKLKAVGIDNNEAAVIRGKKAGLNMECKDLFQYLREAKEGSLAAVTAMHVVEHMTPSQQGEFLALSLKALKPGGLIAMETPNIMNLHVASCDFYSDITHIRPVHPIALRNRMKQMGYKDIDIKFLHPFPQSEQLILDVPGLNEEAKKNFEKINDLIWGCRDCVILATKKEKI
ncbi:methyltransferase domain-containing protein [bacterium]|nr:methyltransferase domain-containing protein [bacterium]